jgi:hypothetical protein
MTGTSSPSGRVTRWRAAIHESAAAVFTERAVQRGESNVVGTEVGLRIS